MICIIVLAIVSEILNLTSEIDPELGDAAFDEMINTDWVFGLLALFETCSVLALYTSLYNFSFVIRNGSAHNIHASQFSTLTLILHACLGTVTALTLWNQCIVAIKAAKD